jgi:hypothetical protein
MAFNATATMIQNPVCQVTGVGEGALSMANKLF